MEGTRSGWTGEGPGAKESSCSIFYSDCAVTGLVVGLDNPAGLLTQNEAVGWGLETREAMATLLGTCGHYKRDSRDP